MLLRAPAPLVVPLMDLRIQQSRLREEVAQSLLEVADSGIFVLGPKVEAFERAFARYVGAEHCIGVNSGTSALHLALIAAGVGAGDEVVTVPMTFIATSWAISYLGAKPVFVDVDPVTYTMDPNQLESRITARTKAILPVHLYGQPCDLKPIIEIGRRHGIPIIEDGAQAHGARYQSKSVGALCQSGCFSFYPGKNLGAYGEGGAVVTNDSRLASRMRALRDHAQSQRYHHDEIGFNYRMDAFQGAVLGIKLNHLEHWTQRRKLLAERYNHLLSDLPVQTPTEAKSRDHVWHLYVILHPAREGLRLNLEAAGIRTGLHYPIPLHLQKAYKFLGHSVGDFPVAERIGQECLTLPLFPEMTESQQDAVVDALADALRTMEWRS
jgi:dTDP-4-amino-4,6-dideoxygalactose transaminase